MGYDPFSKGWIGQVDFVNFNIGVGAFRTTKDFTSDNDNDAFGFARLKRKVNGYRLFEAPPPPPPPAPP